MGQVHTRLLRPQTPVEGNSTLSLPRSRSLGIQSCWGNGIIDVVGRLVVSEIRILLFPGVVRGIVTGAMNTV